jgi:DNA polymerase-3 subunit alpha
MAAGFSDHPEVLRNTLEVADKCNLEIELGVYHLPAVEIPPAAKATIWMIT